jgi:hypothetical protein
MSVQQKHAVLTLTTVVCWTYGGAVLAEVGNYAKALHVYSGTVVCVSCRGC